MASSYNGYPPRCYKRFLDSPEDSNMTSTAYASTCAAQGGAVATFRSESEFDAIGAACADSPSASDYYEAGCWLDGVTLSGYDYDSPSKEGWRWASSDEDSSYLTSSDASNYWDGYEPSGKHPAGYDEDCLQLFTNGFLNDYPCQGQLAVICMKDSS